MTTTYPYGLTTINVTGDFSAMGGQASSGSVIFTPSTTVSLAGAAILTTQPIIAPVINGVMTTQELISTDNAALFPTGWNYQVTVNVPGASASFYAYIGTLAYGASADISQLIPLSTPPANNTTYVTSVNGMTGTVVLEFPGETLEGPLTLAVTPGAVPSTLPVGEAGSSTLTGLQVASSYPGDDVGGGTDGTGRINLYSFQRANVNSFGETIRNFLMRYNAKAMHAWYGPVDLYDGSGNPITAAGWRPWTWTGSHYEANDGASIHGHWEIEVPDPSGALQGRFEVPFIDSNPNSGTYGQVGVTVTNIMTNQAYFTFNNTWGQLRMAAPAGTINRTIEFANSIYTGTVYAQSSSSARWQIGANNTAEAGSNAGSDFIIQAFDDTAASLGNAVTVTRATGAVTIPAAIISPGLVPTSASPAGLFAQTVPFYMVNNSTTTTVSGTLYIHAIQLQAGQTVSNISYLIGTQAALTVSHSWFVLLDSNFVQRAHTADQTSGGITASQLLTRAVVTPYLVPATGKYWLGFMTAAATQPQLGAFGTPQGGTAGVVFPVAGSSTTSLTTPGTDGTTTYLSPTANTNPVFAGVS